MKKLVVGFVVLVFVTHPLHAQRVLGDGIRELAQQIASSVTKEKKTRVAVAPFHELQGSSTVLGAFIAEELVTNLFLAGGLEMVERAQLDKVLKEQKLQQTGAIDPDTAREVGRLSGVDAIVTGSITDFQSYVGINCRLIDAQTGRVFGAAQTKIVKDDDVKKVMGTPLPGGNTVSKPTTAPVKSAGAPESSAKSWTQRTVRGSVDKVKRTIVYGTPAVEVTLAFETTADEPQDLRAPAYSLLDENGDRWEYLMDDRNFVYQGVTLLPQSRARSTFQFTCRAGTCNGSTFSLIDPQTKKILLRGIEVP
ncbi:MAG TPA: FlgO family outer membrane protein [Thermoanaerobaculia bacterium]|nr:FlgO family outer membrane protein [Thermoanaerobaculia bacterium]